MPSWLLVACSLAAAPAESPSVDAIAAGIERREQRYRGARVAARSTLIKPSLVGEGADRVWVTSKPVALVEEWRVGADCDTDFAHLWEYYKVSKAPAPGKPAPAGGNEGSGTDGLLSIYAFDGQKCRTFTPAEAPSIAHPNTGEEEAVKQSVFLSNPLRGFFFPFNVPNPRQINTTADMLKQGDFAVERVETLRGIKAYVLKGSVLPPDWRNRPDAESTRVWISADPDFMFLRWEHFPNATGVPHTTLDVTKVGRQDGVAYPAAGRYWRKAPEISEEQARQLNMPAKCPQDTVEEFEVTSVELNAGLKRADFAIDWPTHTFVVDRVSQKNYQVEVATKPAAALQQKDLDDRLDNVLSERKALLPPAPAPAPAAPAPVQPPKAAHGDWGASAPLAALFSVAALASVFLAYRTVRH